LRPIENSIRSVCAEWFTIRVRFSGQVSHVRIPQTIIFCAVALLLSLNEIGAEKRTDDPVYVFEIASGPAEKTLKVAAVHANVEILYDLETVKGLETNEIRGSFTPFEALQTMLKGTRCHVIKVGERLSYAVVNRRSDLPVNSLHDEEEPLEDSGNSRSSRKDEKDFLGQLADGIQKVLGKREHSKSERIVPEDEIYVLTPFEITAAAEEGYLATSSLAGSRLNTNLSDVGSSISVYTEAFMEDLAATDNETLLAYGLNTEVGGFRGNFINPSSEGIENQNLLEPHNNTRVRGLSAADNTTSYYLTDVPWDRYYVRRVDIQRGANSVLFGLGSPAGIINATPEDAAFGNLGELMLRIDENGSFRGELDVDREILSGELAVKLAVLNEDRRYQQKPAFEDRDRGYFTMTWVPEQWNRESGALRLKASYETGEIVSNRPRMVVPIDRLSMWTAPADASGLSGSYAEVGNYGFEQTPVNQYEDYLTATGEANNNPWISGFFDGTTPLLMFDPGGNLFHITETQSNDRGSWYFDSDRDDAGFTRAIRNDGGASTDGDSIERHIFHPGQISIHGLERVAQELNLPHQGFWKDRSFSSSESFDYYHKLIDGDSKRERQQWEVLELDLTHSFLNNQLGYSAGAFFQDYETEFYAVLGNIFIPGITVDIGKWDRTSQPGARVENPRVGSVMIRDGNPGGQWMERKRESYRLQGFIRHDFERKGSQRWRTLLGKHEGVVVLQNRKLDQRFSRFALMGMGRDYLLERGESIAGPELPPPGSRLAEYDNIIGSIKPDPIFYLNSRSDYRGIEGLSIGLNDLPQGMRSIAGFDATPLPGFDAQAAAKRWYGSPFTSDQFGEEIRQYQSQNPENYRGWQDRVGDYYIANAWANPSDREYLTEQKSFFTEDVDSIAAVWTSRWLQDSIVAMFGWRHDRVVETWHEHDFRENGPQINRALNQNERSTEVESHNWSLKANLTRLTGWDRRLPFDLHLLYAHGEVQTPDPTRVDVFGRTLPNSTGHTEDLSLMITSEDNKWSFRATRYQTIVKDAISTASVNNSKWRLQQVLSQGAFRAGLIETDAMNYTASWLPLSESAREAGYGTEAAYRREVVAPAWRSFESELWNQFPLTRNWYVSEFKPGDRSPPTVVFPDNATLVEDTHSQGWELEFVGKPLPNWSLVATLAKTEAIRENLPGEVFESVVDFVVESMRGPAGEIPIWWFAGPGVGSWLDPFLGELTKARALNGSAQPEIRRWKANLVTNYRFKGGPLNGIGIGSAYRFEDSQIYSYALTEDENGNTRILVDQPFRDDKRHTIDLWLAYSRQLTDRIDWKIQLNLFNAFGENEGVPLNRNPDGTIGLLGIREGQSWALTTTFGF